MTTVTQTVPSEVDRAIRLKASVMGVSVDDELLDGFIRMLRREIEIGEVWSDGSPTDLLTLTEGDADDPRISLVEVIFGWRDNKPEPRTAHALLNEWLLPEGRTFLYVRYSLKVADLTIVDVGVMPERAA